MLADIKPPAHDFHSLAAYLITGKERPTNPDRMAWAFCQNLPTDDPLLAADYMTATAELSKRCKNACYHTVISWHEDERPTPDIMQEIARRTLALVGLGEHEALIMGHADRPHPHLHIMVNRVHPETGKAWSTSHDYARFDRAMKQLADDFGFLYVPRHAGQPDLTDALPKQPNSAATYAAKHGAPTDRPQWAKAESRRYGASVAERVELATDWDDLAFLFAEDGLSLETKGQGLVVGDAQSYTKFSALDLQASAKSFERKFGPRRKRPAKWSQDRIDFERYRLYGALTQARSLDDLTQRLAQYGVGVDLSADRLVFRDADGVATLSDLGIVSRSRLDRQFANPLHGLEAWDFDRVHDLRENLGPLFRSALSWHELHDRLHLMGFSLVRRGRGMVLTDPSGQTSLSSLGLSAAKLERHFADPYGLNTGTTPAKPRSVSRNIRAPRQPNKQARPLPTRSSWMPKRLRTQTKPPGRNIWSVDAVDVARAIGNKADVRATLAAATALRKARRAKKPVLTQLLEDLMEQWRKHRKRPQRIPHRTQNQRER